MVTRKSISRIFSVLFIAVFLLTGVLPVQAGALASPLYASGDLLWAKGMGGTNNDEGNSIAVDSIGNVYTTGHFQDTADFDPGAGSANLTSAGGADIFISKSDSDGNFLWAKSIGGMGYDTGICIAVDSNGNIYTTGNYTGTVDFDPNAGASNLTDTGGGDIFVSKLDTNGNFVWAKNMGGAYFDEGSDITLDLSGNIYTTGSFGGTADFDPGVGISNLSSAGGADIFVSKLDNNGGFVWAKNMGGTGPDTGLEIRLDSNGNIYTTGRFGNTADFDPGASPFNLTSAGLWDIFISKLDNNGNFVWARSMGGAEDDDGYSIALDSNDNIYAMGGFSGTADFDPGPGIFNLTSAGYEDIFISKLDADGNLLWVKSIGGPSYDYGGTIALDSGNNIYMTGIYAGTVDFDPDTGISNLVSVGGKADIFVSKSDSSGNFVWAKSMGGTWSDWGTGIAVGLSGGIYTTGSYGNTADFDPGAGTSYLTSAGGWDIFVSKLENTNPNIFVDVPPSHSVWQYIERLYNAGITGGCSLVPLMYCPENTVTRAQMAVFLLRGIHGSDYIPPAVGDSTGFVDVPTNHPVAAWIKQLAAEGITGGCSNGNYCPDATVTRAQMAVFLLRSKYTSAYTPPPANGDFTDVPVDHLMAAWIEQLAVEGITGGCRAGVYCPDGNVTRAQMAVFLVRTFNLP